MHEDRSTEISTLGFAILGLLARGERTGYDLAKLMKRPVGYFWTAGHAQIYPELSRLLSARLVSYTEEQGRGPRTTKRYRLTADGRAWLKAWLLAEPTPQPIRDQETVRLWSMWLLDPDACRGLISACRDRHAAVLASFVDEQAGVVADPDSRNPQHKQFATRLTLEGGIRSRTAAVEWCDWMLAEFDAAGAR